MTPAVTLQLDRDPHRRCLRADRLPAAAVPADGRAGAADDLAEPVRLLRRRTGVLLAPPALLVGVPGRRAPGAACRAQGPGPRGRPARDHDLPVRGTRADLVRAAAELPRPAVLAHAGRQLPPRLWPDPRGSRAATRAERRLGHEPQHSAGGDTARPSSSWPSPSPSASSSWSTSKGIMLALGFGIFVAMVLYALASSAAAVFCLVFAAYFEALYKGASASLFTMLVKDFFLIILLLRLFWASQRSRDYSWMRQPFTTAAVVFAAYCTALMFAPSTRSILLAVAGLRCWLLWMPVYFPVYAYFRSKAITVRFLTILMLMQLPVSIYGIIQGNIGYEHTRIIPGFYEITKWYRVDVDVNERRRHGGGEGGSDSVEAGAQADHVGARLLDRHLARHLRLDVGAHHHALARHLAYASSPTLRLWALVTALSGAGGLLASGSRAPMFGLAAGVVAMVVMSRQRVAAIGGVVVIVLGTVFVLQDISGGGASASARPCRSTGRSSAPWNPSTSDSRPGSPTPSATALLPAPAWGGLLRRRPADGRGHSLHRERIWPRLQRAGYRRDGYLAGHAPRPDALLRTDDTAHGAAPGGRSVRGHVRGHGSRVRAARGGVGALCGPAGDVLLDLRRGHLAPRQYQYQDEPSGGARAPVVRRRKFGFVYVPVAAPAAPRSDGARGGTEARPRSTHAARAQVTDPCAHSPLGSATLPTYCGSGSVRRGCWGCGRRPGSRPR